MPSVNRPLVLMVPVVLVTEPPMDHADDALPTRSRLDRPLGGDGGGVGSHVVRTIGDQSPWRIPGRDLRGGLHARAEVACDGALVSLVDRGGHEPGRHSATRGDGLPDLFGRPGNLDFGLDRALAGWILLDAHVDSSFAGWMGS